MDQAERAAQIKLFEGVLVSLEDLIHRIGKDIEHLEGERIQATKILAWVESQRGKFLSSDEETDA